MFIPELKKSTARCYIRDYACVLLTWQPDLIIIFVLGSAHYIGLVYKISSNLFFHWYNNFLTILDTQNKYIVIHTDYYFHEI